MTLQIFRMRRHFTRHVMNMFGSLYDFDFETYELDTKELKTVHRQARYRGSMRELAYLITAFSAENTDSGGEYLSPRRRRHCIEASSTG
jgi:hypothetical protein